MKKYLSLFVIFAALAVAPQLKAQDKNGVRGRDIVPQPTNQGVKRTADDFSRRRSASGNMSGRGSLLTKTSAVQKKLKIDAEDSAKYALFLGNPNSGIIKLLAQTNCESKNRNNYDCVINNESINEFASSYLFAERRYTNRPRGNVSLVSNNLDSTAGKAQTIIVDLGDEPLDNLTLESKGAAYLKKFVPASQLGQARKQYDDFLKSVKVGHFIYSKSAPVALDHTYVIRSIDYLDSTIVPGKKYLDTIVAVKIIRVDKDGSVTLLWKELSRKDAPVLLVNKQ